MNVGMYTLLALKDAGDLSAAKAISSWIALAPLQDSDVQVRVWWNQKTDQFESGLTWVGELS